MNLFQTAPIVDQYLNYKYQTKLKAQQGDIDTGIAESKNETTVTTTGMTTESQEKQTLQTNLFRLGEKVIDRAPGVVGVGLGGYIAGKNSNNKNNGDRNSNNPYNSSSGSGVTNSRYDEVSNQLDKMIGNSEISDLKQSLKDIRNIDSNRFFTDVDNVRILDTDVIKNSSFSVDNILPIVTTGLGAIGMSLGTLLSFM